MSASAHPSSRELHQEHASERARVAGLERVRAREDEVRRMLDERWRRRILPLLASESDEPTDFYGCVA